MTTPNNPPDPPAEGITPGQHPDIPAMTPPGTEPLAPAAVAPAPYPTGYQVAPPQPFAPVARAPRVPWVNPARRGHVAAAVIAGALLFGGCGLVVGHAAAVRRDHRPQRDGVTRFEPGPGRGNGFGHFKPQRMGPVPGQNLPNLPGRPPGSTPAPSPSVSPTR